MLGMPTRPKNLDLSQLAKRIVDEAAGDEPQAEAPAPKNAAAVKRGKLGGAKGGAARAEAIKGTTKAKEIASKAAKARWNHSKAG